MATNPASTERQTMIEQMGNAYKWAPDGRDRIAHVFDTVIAEALERAYQRGKEYGEFGESAL